MELWMIWFMAALLLVVAEMLTLTFFLLIVAVGAFAAGLLAFLAVPLAAQIVVGSVVALLGFGVLRKVRPPVSRRDADANPDVNPDIGAVVLFESIDPDGVSGVVLYRGANWRAAVSDAGAELGKSYVIVRVDGAQLIVSPKV